MDKKTWKKIARILKQVYSELEMEALKRNIKLDSAEYDMLVVNARETVLSKFGYTLAQYQETGNEIEAERRGERPSFEEMKSTVDEYRALPVLTEEQVREIANEVVKENYKAPEIINRIVKVIQEKTPPQVIKETIIQKEEYDPAPLMAEIGSLNQRLDDIKIPVPEVLNLDKLKVDLLKESKQQLQEVMDFKWQKDVPDFRKLAMGLQAQIDTFQIQGATTLDDISRNSTDATKSLYTMTSTIPVEFKTSDAHTLLYLDETNERIGIGTNAPSSPLQVVGDGTNTGITFWDPGLGSTYKIGMSVDNGGNAHLYTNFAPLYISGGNTAPVYFRTDNTIRMSVITGGNVGIGTIAPATALDIVGSLTLTNTTSSSTGVIYKGANRFIHNFALAGTSGANTFVGISAGNFTMTGSTGAQGSFNTGIGENSLKYNTTGNYDTAQGAYSLTSNTTGGYSSAQGAYSLYSNTTGIRNTAQGFYSLGSNTTGSYNSAQGMYSLYSNTTGDQNSAVGYSSLFTNTTGGYNSAQGFQSLFFNTTGDLNSAYGLNSLYSNTTGGYNSAQGAYALFGNTTGGFNSALGYGAGRFITDGATDNATGTNSLFLGYDTRPLADGETNQIVIGSGAIGLGSNTVVLGNSSIATTALRGNVGIGTTAPGIAGYNKALTISANTDGQISALELQSKQTSDADLSGIEFLNDTNRVVAIVAKRTGANNSAELKFFTNNAGSFGQRMVIDKQGNVGIGTTAPDQKFQVSANDGYSTDGLSGQISIKGLTDPNKRLNFGFETTGNYGYIEAAIVSTGWQNLALQPSGGNVGIGTAAPAYILDVAKSFGIIRLTSTTGTNAAYSDVVNTGGHSYIGSEGSVAGANFIGDTAYATIVGNSGANPLQFITDNTVRMTVLPTSGNVGIGTTSPTAVLHLKAGTATASTAPLKFTSGTLNTTAEAGAVEFLTDAYYGTITTGATRKTFAFLESPTFTTPTANYFIHSVGNALTAAGTTRTDALQLAKEINNVTTAAAGTGVILPVGVVGMRITIFNAGANLIQVYASASETIDTVAGATGVPLTNAKRCEYFFTAANTWISAQLGVVSA